ncbi:MAG: MopE-related protein [Myxococcaceae bacterium]
MRVLLLALAALAASVVSCTKYPADGAIQLRIAYEGFQPGCVRVLAVDGEPPHDTRTVDLPSSSDTESPLYVAVLRPQGWSTSIQLSALAYEGACAEPEKAVATQYGSVLAFAKGQAKKHELTLKATDADHDGFVAKTEKGTDCDDTRDSVRPGAAEVCDGIDNNCDGQVDTGNEMGGACRTQAGCAGTMGCTPEGRVDCLTTLTASRWYQDEDQDGQGNEATAVTACGSPGPLYSATAGDCDDGDPFTFSGATERCDDKDSDCNGVSNDTALGGVCAAAAWVRRIDASPGEWVSAVSPKPGELLVIGSANRTGARAGDPNTAFTLSSAACGGMGAVINWSATDSVPGTSTVVLGAAGGQLASLTLGTAGCTPSTTLAPGGSVAGLVAFSNAGTAEIFGIAATGQLFRFRPPSTVESLAGIANVRITDLHGSSAKDLIAVGQSMTTNMPYVAQYDGTGWTEVPLNLTPTLGAGSLRGVWAVNPRLAYAVGDNSVVLKREKGTWARVITPANVSFTSVLAFGPNAVFATEGANVRRLNAGNWDIVGISLLTTRLTDLAGTSPADLWAVGSNGTVLHWPERVTP